MKITTQLRGVALGLFVLGICNVISVYLNAVGSDSTVVNQAGLVRGGTQRLVKLEMAAQVNDRLIQALDKKVNGLIKGDEELGLPPAKDPNFLSKLKQVESSWQILKETIKRVRQEPNYRNILLSQSEDYFKLSDETVLAAEKYSQAKVQQLRAIQLTILGMTIAILVTILLLTHRIVSTLQTSIGVIATSSTQIASTVEQQERMISVRASAVSQTTTTMNELGASSMQSAEQAEASAASSRQTLFLAEDGAKAVQQTIGAMLTLKDKVGAIAEQILDLSEQTGQIKKIADLVSDFARHINVLAINIAVEAARANDQGKGFGIIAAEVCKLVEQSQRSSEKINSLVAEIQAAMNSTVAVTDEGTNTVLEGIKLSQETGVTFIGVIDAISDVSLNSQQILLSAKQQAIAAQQIMETMNVINQDVKATASGITEVRLSIQQLHQAAQNLKEIV